MLRYLSGGFHLNQALRLIELRSRVPHALLSTDDFNTVLTSCVFATEESVIQKMLAQWKVQGLLVGAAEDWMRSSVATALEAHDLGDVEHLWEQRLRRSKEMHDPAARAALSVSSEGLSGAKRKRGAGSGPGPAAEAKEITDGDGGGDAAPSAAAVGEAFKRSTALLMQEFATPAGRFASARHRKAGALIGGLRSGVPTLALNARSYVLALKAAVGAGAVADARSLFAEALSSGALARDTLYAHAQPAFIRELASLGVIEAGDDLLAAEPGSPKDAFLLAAAAAGRGDQHGSKHGAAVVRGGRVLSVGHNHRFGLPGDPHFRVMHAEVHALVQLMPPLASAAAATMDSIKGHIPECVSKEDHAAAADRVAGCDVYIVELDGHGVGYEEAVPCPMCQSVVCALGVGRALYSSHSGIVTAPCNHKPELQCVSFQMARRRVYPKGTSCPDAPGGADSTAPAGNCAGGAATTVVEAGERATREVAVAVEEVKDALALQAGHQGAVTTSSS